jgi:hypothetical protein
MMPTFRVGRGIVEVVAVPKILTVELTPAQQAEVRRRLAGHDLSGNERRRLECIRLLGRGLTVPQVADLVECNPVTASAPPAIRPSAFCWKASRIVVYPMWPRVGSLVPGPMEPSARCGAPFHRWRVRWPG